MLLQKYLEKGSFSWVMIVLLRYLRTQPCVIALLFIGASTWNYIGKGPMYSKYGEEFES